jgi:hypothetical protein
LSLVELAIGRYPIPVPCVEEIDRLFLSDPKGLAQRTESKNRRDKYYSKLLTNFKYIGSNNIRGQPMAIFELLEYIVHQVFILILYF